jgi:hypothetical protein
MKARIITQMIIGAAIAIILATSAYAESKKITAIAQERKRLGRMAIEGEIGGVPVNIGNLTKYLRVFSSSDPDWDKTSSYSVSYGSHQNNKGYIVDVHPGGDQTLREFEGTWELKDGKMTAEAEGWFIGGTGKFKGISGKWKMRTTRTSTGTVSELSTEYNSPFAYFGN